MVRHLVDAVNQLLDVLAVKPAQDKQQEALEGDSHGGHRVSGHDGRRLTRDDLEGLAGRPLHVAVEPFHVSDLVSAVAKPLERDDAQELAFAETDRLRAEHRRCHHPKCRRDRLLQRLATGIRDVLVVPVSAESLLIGGIHDVVGSAVKAGSSLASIIDAENKAIMQAFYVGVAAASLSIVGALTIE